MQGIGLEKTHLNIPLSSRRTPPMAESDKDGANDASTFHFKDPSGGGDHTMLADLRGRGHAPVASLESHNKQSGFLTISEDEYGNKESHPLIHHPRRININSWSCDEELALPLKILALRSFQIVHNTIEKIAVHTFLKKRIFAMRSPLFKSFHKRSREDPTDFPQREPPTPNDMRERAVKKEVL